MWDIENRVLTYAPVCVYILYGFLTEILKI